MKNLTTLVRNLGLLAAAVALFAPGIAEAQLGPYQYYAITPCRAYDTRTGLPSAGGTNGGVMTTATPRAFRMRNLCGVPATAAAVSVNLTVTNPQAVQGDLRVAPYPGTFPAQSTSNYYAGETVANGAIVPLGTVNPGTGPDIQIDGAGAPFTQPWTYHLLIDVTGYFQ
ncbi:hypothetical protein ARNL5_00418 [Anaerolineae bacterium]|nr:hypothetical protein ARNL5_00418 [Anaerolineae bacterium]